MLALNTPEIADKYNDQKIADMAGVTKMFVNELRRSVVNRLQLDAVNPAIPAPAKTKRGKNEIEAFSLP